MFKIVKKSTWEQQQQELAKAQATIKQYQEELAETKIILDIRVKAKTHQLQEEAKIFEERFSQRAKDLKEKIEEFEEFQRLMVGRELKMIELKKALEETKQKTIPLKKWKTKTKKN